MCKGTRRCDGCLHNVCPGFGGNVGKARRVHHLNLMTLLEMVHKHIVPSNMSSQTMRFGGPHSTPLIFLRPPQRLRSDLAYERRAKCSIGARLRAECVAA